MIFKQWEQVVGLKEPPKGQTRRPVKRGSKPSAGHVFMASDYALDKRRLPVGLGQAIHSVHRADGRLKWQVGRTYAVQRPDKKTVGRFLLTKIRRERLGDISEEDCLAEGISKEMHNGTVWYKCPEHISTSLFLGYRTAFSYLWEDIHGKGAWDRMKDDDVWVLELVKNSLE